MTATKNNSIFKKLGALAMAMCLTCALAVSASAKEGYNVTVYTADGSDLSMADDIVAGNATITEHEAGGYTVQIPIVPIEDFDPADMMPVPLPLPLADGYLRSVTVTGASASVSPSSGFYTNAMLTITVPSDGVPEDADTLTFSVTSSSIDLYIADTQTSYPFMNHTSPEFKIVVTL